MELPKKLLSVISLIFSIYLSSLAFGGFTKRRLFHERFFRVGKALSYLLFVRKISNNCRISPSLLNHLSKISEHASPCLYLCLSKERDASRCKRIANTFIYKWTSKTVMFLFASKVDTLQLLLTLRCTNEAYRNHDSTTVYAT